MTASVAQVHCFGGGTVPRRPNKFHSLVASLGVRPRSSHFSPLRPNKISFDPLASTVRPLARARQGP